MDGWEVVALSNHRKLISLSCTAGQRLSKLKGSGLVQKSLLSVDEDKQGDEGRDLALGSINGDVNNFKGNLPCFFPSSCLYVRGLVTICNCELFGMDSHLLPEGASCLCKLWCSG